MESETLASPGRPRSADVDRRIVTAALELLLESGFDGIGYEQVARIAGVGRPTVYRRYPERSDLLFAAISEGHRVQSPDPASVPAEPDVEDLVEGWAQSLSHSRGRRLDLLLMTGFATHPELYAEFRTYSVDAREAAIDGVLERARTRGEFPADADVPTIRSLLSGAVAHHLLTEPECTDRQAIADHLRRCLTALGYERRQS